MLRNDFEEFVNRKRSRFWLENECDRAEPNAFRKLGSSSKTGEWLVVRFRGSRFGGFADVSPAFCVRKNDLPQIIEGNRGHE
jgi:hypothetical protein